MIAAVRYAGPIWSGAAAISARLEQGRAMAMRVTARKATRWELYRVADDGLEEFAGHAEPWQEELLERLLARHGELVQPYDVFGYFIDGRRPAWPLQVNDMGGGS